MNATNRVIDSAAYNTPHLASGNFVVYLSEDMSRNSRFIALSAGCVGLAVASFAPPAFAKPPRLSTLDTNVGSCPAKEPGAPKRCAPQSGFSVIETKSELSDFRLVVREETGFQVFLEPSACQEARFDGPVQWRQFDDQPFAVIQSIKCSDPSAPTATKGKSPKARTVVVVRGLPGFESLNLEIDSAKHKNALKDAVELADRFLKAEWPKIEEQRSFAEAAAQKDSEKEEAPEVAEPAPEKVLPASQKRVK
jgi:hypothetical protein